MTYNVRTYRSKKKKKKHRYLQKGPCYILLNKRSVTKKGGKDLFFFRDSFKESDIWNKFHYISLF